MDDHDEDPFDEQLLRELMGSLEAEIDALRFTVDEWLAAAGSADRRDRLRATRGVLFDNDETQHLRSHPAVQSEIVKLLTDPDPGVGASAALALDDWHVPEALPVILHLLPEVSVRHRCQLLLALAGQQAPIARECLEQYAAGGGEEAGWAVTALRWADGDEDEGGAES